jgi:hypothetical protein
MGYVALVGKIKIAYKIVFLKISGEILSVEMGNVLELS